MNRWYRERMRAQAAEYFIKWQMKIGVEAADWGIRSMRTRWGTCQIESRRILLNLELAKKPRACLEYIIVHELMHLLERHHNDRFRGLMDQFLPGWRSVRDELNRAPLAHGEWDY